MRKTNSKESR